MADTLSLNVNNPYAKGYIVNLDEDKQILKRVKAVYDPLVNKDKSHILRDNEKIWDIAYGFYTNSKLWYKIADANNIFNPLELTTNTQLLIPDLDNFK